MNLILAWLTALVVSATPCDTSTQAQCAAPTPAPIATPAPGGATRPTDKADPEIYNGF